MDISSALVRRGLISLVVLFAVMAALLFGGAGTLHWWPGWLFLAVYFAWSIWVERVVGETTTRRCSRGGCVAAPGRKKPRRRK